MTPSARSLDHSHAPDRCANAARGAVRSRQDGANSTNVPPGSIPASRADRRLRLPHSRGDAPGGHEDAAGVAEEDAAAPVAAAGAVEVNAAEIAVAVASVVAAAAGADPTRTTARTSRMLAFALGLCDG